MTVAPCEARKYLGVGGGEGDPFPTCGAAIQWRVVFWTPEGPEGEAPQRAAIAYFCTEHRDAVVGVLHQGAETLSEHLGEIHLSRYTPRTPQRIEADLAAQRSAERAEAIERAWIRSQGVAQ